MQVQGRQTSGKVGTEQAALSIQAIGPGVGHSHTKFWHIWQQTHSTVMSRVLTQLRNASVG